MANILVLKKELARLEKAEEKLASRIDATKEKLVRVCKHPKDSIRELRHDRSAPWTICLDCGYAEEGWGIGTWKLPSGYIDHVPLPSIDENRFFKVRTAFRTQDQIVHEKIHVEFRKQPKEMSECPECKER